MKRGAKRGFWHAGALSVAALLSACSGTSGGGSPYGTGDPNLAAANPGGGSIDPFLTDGQAVLRALDAIAGRSGRPFRVTSMNADRINGLTVDVQEPAHRVNVDEYKVAPDGTLSGPTPVRLVSLNGGPIAVADVDRKAFDPKAVGFGRLTQTAREAIARSKFPDARVTEWDFDGMSSDDRRFMYLEAARARPVALLGAHLNILAMRF